jgi:ketosteroid isomerase-like protein
MRGQTRGSSRAMRLVGTMVLAVMFVIGAMPPAFAQPADQKAIQDAVEAFLLHLGDGDFDKVAADLAPKAIVVITRQRDGKWVNTYQTGDEWLAALKRNTNFSKFREPITNATVTIDSDALAYLRADFQVVRDGKALSHGVDQFTLVREDGRWKIAAVAYTSIAGM